VIVVPLTIAVPLLGGVTIATKVGAPPVMFSGTFVAGAL